MKHSLKIFLTFLIFNSAFLSAQKEILRSDLWVKGESGKEFFKMKESARLKNVPNENFNFNPIVDFSKAKISKKIKGLIKNQSSLFLVFKCVDNDEINLISFQKGIYKTYFTSKKIKSDSEIILNKGDSKKGMILSYSSSKNSILNKRGGSLVLDDALFDDVEKKNQLMEILYFPSVLNELDKNKIESYLSVKYGISLIGDKDYFNSKGDKIWDFKSNEATNYRVTGIGRDDFFDLNQKQSGNYEKDGLYIALNKMEKNNIDNVSIISDRSYMVWGDNDKSISFDKQDSGERFKKIKRIWKTQTSSEDPLTIFQTQFVVNKDEMVFKNNNINSSKEEIWLAIDSTGTNEFNYTNAAFFKATLDNEKQLVFDPIKMKSNRTYLFTFVKAPDFFMTYDIVSPTCLKDNNGIVKIKLVGGIAPFHIHLKSENFEKSFTTNEDYVTIDALSVGNYELEISNYKQVQKCSFLVNTVESNTVSINSQYYLDEAKSIEIAPDSIPKKESKLKYQWFLDKDLVSNETKFSAKSIGNYKLVISNENGCENEYPFIVLNRKSEKNRGWTLFPDPVKAGEKYKIHFNLKELTPVVLKIFDIDGRILLNKDLGMIKEYQFEGSLLISGTYLINISLNGIVETTKLIVK